LAFAAIAAVLAANYTVWSNPTVPSLPSFQREINQPFDSAQGKPAQTAPVVVPMKEWPKVQVVWSEPFLIKSLADLPPSLPAGKGFYRETPNAIADGSGSPEALKFALDVLPQWRGVSGTSALAGVAQDPADPRVMLAAIDVVHAVQKSKNILDVEIRIHNYLLLSLNSGESWYDLPQFSSRTAGITISRDVRVVKEGSSVVVYNRDLDFVAPMWRRAVLPLTSLP
jgi:hypothetical protein